MAEEWYWEEDPEGTGGENETTFTEEETYNPALNEWGEANEEWYWEEDPEGEDPLYTWGLDPEMDEEVRLGLLEDETYEIDLGDEDDWLEEMKALEEEEEGEGWLSKLLGNKDLLNILAKAGLGALSGFNRDVKKTTPPRSSGGGGGSGKPPVQNALLGVEKGVRKRTA